MEIQDAKQARPHCELIAELLDSRQPKTEREHAAVREIERLRHDIERHIAIASEYATECERLRAELETERMKLAMKAPITFEVACKAWGDVPSLCGDTTRRCFFAVWALLCFEWAEAMVEHAQSRKVGAGMARNPLRDATIDAALAAKGE